MVGSREPQSGNNSLVPALFYVPRYPFGAGETIKKRLDDGDLFRSRFARDMGKSQYNTKMQPFAAYHFL